MVTIERELKVAGKDIPRLDGHAKVTGEYQYGMDVSVPGMLHGKVIRSPYPHARILGFNTEKARALPGVLAVITGADVKMRLSAVVSDQPVLAWEVARYKGEPVALIAATKPEIADEAARLLEIEYEPLPVISDPEEAMKPGAMLLHPEWESYDASPVVAHVRQGNINAHAVITKGDIEQGFAEADVVLEDTYVTDSVHQAHVEPRTAIGVVSKDGKNATVYTNTQLPYWMRSNVAHVLGIPESDVVIVPTGIGGGFGSKLYPQLEPLVALLSRETGRPVQIVTPIKEEIEAGLPRHPFRVWVKSGVKKDGTLVARQARVIIDSGAYTGSAAQLTSVAALVLVGPYKSEHVQFDVYSVYTNKTNFGAYRGPGGPQIMFGMEQHFDELAKAIGIDAYRFRLKNVVEEGDQAVNGQELGGVGMRECLEKAAEAIEWDKPAGPNRGKGITCGWWTTTGGSSGCVAKLDTDGNVVITIGTQEIGTGAVAAGIPQVMAEYMNVPAGDVRLIVGDTATAPYDFGSQGSRTVFNIGRAAKVAAEELTMQIKSVAGDMMEVAAEDLEVVDGEVRVKGVAAQKVTLAEVAQKALSTRGGLHARGTSIPQPYQPDQDRLIACLYPAFHYPSFHAHACEVEVDPGTGEVTVTRYVAVHDVGRVISPTYAEGQVHGGVVQGIGMALMEGIQYQDGEVKNPNWTDYKLPTIADAPDIEVILLEYATEGGPFGAKGLGEPPVIHPPAAIANAVAQATGVRFHSLPLTAEKVMMGLRKGEG